MEWDYKANLKRARNEGLIMGDIDGFEDAPNSYSHLGSFGFNTANSRDLSSAMLPLLKVMKGEEGLYGELGGGSGKGLSDVSVFMQTQGMRHKLINISITPIDPFARLRFFLRGKKKISLQSKEGEELFQCDLLFTQDLLRTQNETRSGIIELLDAPYIHDQRIGVFPESADLTGLKGKFLWLYDSLGAFYYTLYRECEDKACTTINELIADNGVFLLATSPPEDKVRKLYDHFQEGDVVIFGKGVALFMRRESVALDYLSGEFPGIFNGQSIISCPKLRQLLAEALKKLEGGH